MKLVGKNSEFASVKLHVQLKFLEQQVSPVACAVRIQRKVQHIFASKRLLRQPSPYELLRGSGRQ